MKRFITKIAFFTVAAYLIALGLDAMISHGMATRQDIRIRLGERYVAEIMLRI